MKRKTRASFNHQLTFATNRPKRRGRWILAVLFLPLIAGGLAFVLSKELYRATPEVVPLPATAQAPEIAPAPPPAPEPPPIVRVDIDYVVRPKDSLGQIFTLLKFDVTELPAILGVPTVRDRFKAIQPDEKFTFSLENGVLHGIRRRISETEILSIRRGERGFTAEVIKTPIETKTAQVRGTINSSLFVAGRAVGLSADMVQQLANDIFAWDIDFARDVRPGDRFNVVYEQKYRDGEYLGDGRIVAAEYIADGEVHRAVRYTSADGKVDALFTPDGRNVRRQVLRTPLDFTRVNPNSNPDRRVPLLNVMSAHQGIDYPAPVGTVVKATGDGVVRFLGANGEYGNTVIIEHGPKNSTLYAHLATFTRELKANQRVRQGDIIGLVGHSGAATAPHLHYEYRVDGAHTDPRDADLPAGEPIPSEYAADFHSKLAALLAGLEQAGNAVVTAFATN